MTTIFTNLSIFAMLLLATNMVLGVATGDYNGEFARLVPITQELGQLRRQSPRPLKEIRRAEAQRDLVYERIEPFRLWSTVHMLFGVAGALVVVLVNSISITYFVGTSRWCREVVDTYRLDVQLTARSAALKRKTFPWALGGVLVIVGVIALGAAANPGTIRAGTADWVLPHFVGALLGMAAVGWSFTVQRGIIRDNLQIINRIVAEVGRIRAERGLDDPADDAA